MREMLVRGERVIFDPANPQRPVLVASKSHIGLWYEVSVVQGCECDGFRRRRRCRHMAAVIEVMELISPKPVAITKPTATLVECPKCRRQVLRLMVNGLCSLCMSTLDD